MENGRAAVWTTANPNPTKTPPHPAGFFVCLAVTTKFGMNRQGAKDAKEGTSRKHHAFRAREPSDDPMLHESSMTK